MSGKIEKPEKCVYCGGKYHFTDSYKTMWRSPLCREREAHEWSKTHLKVMQNFARKVAERVECIRPHAETFGIQLGQCLTEAIPSVVEEWLKEREARKKAESESEAAKEREARLVCKALNMTIKTDAENQKLRELLQATEELMQHYHDCISNAAPFLSIHHWSWGDAPQKSEELKAKREQLRAELEAVKGAQL